MGIIRKINTFIKSPRESVSYCFSQISRSIRCFFLSDSIYKRLPDIIALKIKYKEVFGVRLDLHHPKTFNEKIQWLKLYNRKPEYTIMADKLASKEFIAKRVGKEYIIPCLGKWKNAHDIDYNELPDRFVLKCNHDCGSVIICKDKDSLNFEEIYTHFSDHLNNDYSISGREWVYKNIDRYIIAEPYLEDIVSGDLRDYKFFCFGGEPRFFKIDYNRFGNHKAVYYDIYGNTQLFGEEALLSEESTHIDIPNKLDEMIRIAKELSKGVPFLRVDLFCVNDKILCGELTFYPGNGFRKFYPNEWDKKIGDLLELPKKNY